MTRSVFADTEDEEEQLSVFADTEDTEKDVVIQNVVSPFGGTEDDNAVTQSDLPVPVERVSTPTEEMDEHEIDGNDASFWQAVGDQVNTLGGGKENNPLAEAARVGIVSPLETLGNMPSAAVGLAEAGIQGGTSLVGALAGVIAAAAQSVNNDVTGQKVDGFWKSFVEKLPNEVHENMARYMYSPRTEDGQAIEGMFGLMLEELASWGEAGADKVLEHGRENDWDPIVTAATATALRIVPETVFFLAPFGGKKLMDVKRASDAKVRRRALGDIESTFDQELIRRYGDPTKKLREGISGLESELTVLKRDVAPDPLKTQYILSQEQKLNTLIAEEARQSGKSGETVMNPREVVDMATEEQILQINEVEVIRSLKGETKDRPVVIRRSAGGSEIVSGLEKAFDAAVFGEKEIPIKIIQDVITPSTKAAEWKSMNNMFDSWLIIENENRKALKLPRKEQLARDWWDRQYPLKQRLIEQDAASGWNTIKMYEKVNTSSTAAALRAEEYIGRVYKGLSHRDELWLDRVIEALRQVQIDKIQAEKFKQGKTSTPYMIRAGNKRQKNYETYLEAMNEELGPAKFRDLVDRADQYFNINKELLSFLRENKLITAKDFENLKDIDWRKNEYLSQIDPVIPERFKPKHITVRESGVEYLKRGKRDAKNINSKDLLMDHTFSIHARVFKNRALQELAKVAEATFGNKDALVKKISEKRSKDLPSDRVALSYFVEGEKKFLSMSKRWGEMWEASTPEMASHNIQLLRWMMLSPIVKQSAVGLNPTFFLTDFPRNISHIYLAASKSAPVTIDGVFHPKGVRLYAPEAVLKTAQIVVDTASVFSDAVFRKGRYKDFAVDGGPRLLAHLAQDRQITATGMRHHDTKIAKGRRVLSYLNETSEIMTRLMVRERALKRNLSKSDANYEALRLIDFGQAGRRSKTLDYMIPFFNPIMQAIRTGVRGVKQDPANAAILSAEYVGATGMLYFYNWMTNPECMANIPDENLVRGINICLPPSENLIDPFSSEVQQQYLHFAVENLFMPLGGTTNLAMRKVLEGRAPNNMSLEMIRSTIPFMPSTMITPVIDLIVKAGYGLDTYKDMPVYPGAHDVLGSEEYFAQHKSNATPLFYVMAGKYFKDEYGMELSPARTQAAVDALLTSHPINPVGSRLLDQLLFGDMPDHERWKMNDQKLADNPMLSRVLRRTSATHNAFTDADRTRREESTETSAMNKHVDVMAGRHLHGELSMDQGMKAIAEDPTIPALDKDRYLMRFITQTQFDRIWKGVMGDKPDGLIPGKAWYRSLGQEASGRDRARAFFEKWRGLINFPQGEQRQRKMVRMAQQLTYGGTSVKFWNNDFIMEWNRLQEGTDLEMDKADSSTKQIHKFLVGE